MLVFLHNTHDHDNDDKADDVEYSRCEVGSCQKARSVHVDDEGVCKNQPIEHDSVPSLWHIVWIVQNEESLEQ